MNKHKVKTNVEAKTAVKSPHNNYNSDVRNGVIKVLAKYENLRAKQIYKLLNTNVSYQAAFKMIKSMVNENVLEADKLSYKLNSHFINDTLHFVEELKLNEKEKYASVCKKVKDKHETVTLKFNKQIELLNYIFGFLDYCSTIQPNDYCFLHVANLYGIFSFPHDTYQHLSNVTRNTKFYIVVKQDTKWNEAITDLWKKLGINIRTGLNFGGKDCAVYKTVVLKVSCDESKISEIAENARQVQQLSNVNIMEMIYNMYEKDIEFTLEISNDPKFAGQIKERILSEF
jgi:hypothetical protein